MDIPRQTHYPIFSLGCPYTDSFLPNSCPWDAHLAEHTFEGFTPELVDFLEDLMDHNNREWFHEHKDLYEVDVRGPALSFIRAIKPHLHELSPHFLASDKKVGGSLMRIHRDVRFGKNKKPYKTNVGIQFRHDMGKDIHAPGFYVHISPSSSFVGVGMWRPDGPTLRKVRDAIVEYTEDWLAVRDDPTFTEYFRLDGDSLKRAPRGFDKDHECIDDLKRKSFIALQELDEEELYEDDFVEKVMASFWASAPFMQFLCKAIGVAF